MTSHWKACGAGQAAIRSSASCSQALVLVGDGQSARPPPASAGRWPRRCCACWPRRTPPRVRPSSCSASVIVLRMRCEGIEDISRRRNVLGAAARNGPAWRYQPRSCLGRPFYPCRGEISASLARQDWGYTGPLLAHGRHRAQGVRLLGLPLPATPLECGRPANRRLGG